MASPLAGSAGSLVVMGTAAMSKRVFRVTEVEMDEEGEVIVKAVEHRTETVSGAEQPLISKGIASKVDGLFLIDGKNEKIEVASMPGIYRWSSDLLLKEIEACLQLGLKSFCVFPSINDKLKDKTAKESLNTKGLYLSTLKLIKNKFPEVVLMTDVAMDPYSSDGHDGLVKNGQILNDETLDILCKMALAQAEAGADIIGPSDMMDVVS